MRSLLFLSLLFSSLLSSSQWYAINPMPLSSRDDGVAFVFNDTAFVGTGMDAGYHTTRDFASYSIEHGWNSAPSLPMGTERQYATAWRYLNRGYVFGGISNGKLLSDLWIFSLSSNQWKVDSSFPSSPRYGCVSFVIQSDVYVVGGVDTTGKATSEVWRFNLPSSTWSKESNTPFTSFRSASHVVNDTAFVFLGRDENGNYRQETYAFTPSNGWMKKASFPENGKSYVAVYHAPDSHCLTLVGGSDSSGFMSDDIWDYDYQRDIWTLELWTFPEGIRGGIAFEIDRAKLYAGGLTPLGRVNSCFRSNYDSEYYNLTDHFILLENPSRDFINFSPPLPTCEISIWNIHGQLLFHNEEYDTREKIDISSWSPGHYMIRLSNKQIGSSTLRLIVP